MLSRTRAPGAICRTDKAFEKSGPLSIRGSRPADPRPAPITAGRSSTAARSERAPLSRVAAAVIAVFSGLTTPAQQWVPPIQKVPHLFIQTEVLGVRGGVTRSLGAGTIETSPGKPGTFTLPLDLGPAAADHPTSLEIEVTQSGPSENKIGLTVATTIAITSRSGEVSHIRRERVAEVDEGRSFFHQAYENAAAGTSVLLTLTPESRLVPELVKPATSAPVTFKVSLSRITPDGEVPLEDNVLRALEGSPVSYAFRIAVAGSPPVEAVPLAMDGAADGGRAEAAEPGADAPSAAAPPGTPSSAEESAEKKTPAKKPKKKSKKERGREALAQYQSARAAQAAADAALTLDPPEPPEPHDSPAAPVPSDPPASPPSAVEARADAAGPTEELELTLLPHRVESGILMVEVSLRSRAPGLTGADRSTLVKRTHAITSNGSFDISVSGIGAAGTGSYKFTVQARF